MKKSDIPWENYDLVLFDFDDTIVDFNVSERAAFTRICSFSGIEDSPENYQKFKKINSSLWARHNSGEIKRELVFKQRFEDFFKHFDLQIDSNEVNEVFLSGLPDQVELFQNILGLITYLKATKAIGIITNGHGPTQRVRIAKSGILGLIDFILISDEVGFSKPDPRIFELACSNAKILDNRKVLMIGDSLDADIRGGSQIGFDTCWISHGLGNTSKWEPTYTVVNPVEFSY